MRSGKSALVVISCALISLAWLIGGCSDDKPVVPVDPADAQYQQVISEVGLYLDTTIAHFAAGLAMAEQSGVVTDVITSSYSPVDPDSLLTGDGWNVVYVTDLVSGYNSFRVDSIQFRHNGIPQDQVGGSDAMAIVHNWSYENPDTTQDYRNVQVRSVLVFSNINTDNAVINGTRNERIQVKSGVFSRDFDIQMQFNGVTVPSANEGWTKGCPSAGTVQGTVDFTQQSGTGLPVTTTWTFQIAITNGGADVQVSAGPYTREYTCTLCTM